MSRRAKTIATTQFAAALMAGTMLAGLPAVATAQDNPAPVQDQAAPAPAAAAVPAPEESQIIKTIAVAGAQRLEPQTILSYVQLRPGQVYTAAAADQALKDLAATDLFSDYRIENNNGNVVISVTENPVINRVILEGNKRIKDDKIEKEIKLAPRQIFTRAKVRADVNRIIELYKRQGRFAATVEPKMVQLSQNRVDVVFEINEGAKSKVRAINIIGNEVFDDGKLKGQMLTKEAGLTKIFSSGTSYDPDRMAYDQQKLRQFYLTNGYADFRVVSAVAELTPDKKDFIITYVVEEGKRYKFGDVKVDSQLHDLDSDLLTRTLPEHKGDWYNAKMIEDTIDGLTETAGTVGYAFAKVEPQIDRDPDTLTMNITFKITQSPRTYVERVNVNGNTLTKDKVIRREFRVAEGDAFNSLAVKRTTNRIKSLGYFQENFEVKQVEGSTPDRIILDADVEEQPTGQLSLSAGYSSLEGLIFEGSVQQKNFRGAGQTVGLSVNWSNYSRGGSISFVEPYLFDKNISAGVEIYHTDYNDGYFNKATTTYSQATTGMRLTLGVPLTEYTSLIGRYTFNYDDVSVNEAQYYLRDASGNLTCSPLLVGRYLCDAIGKRTTSMISASLAYQNLDNAVRPTRGRSASATLDFAGLGGSNRFVRLQSNAAEYWPLGSGFILSVTGEAGVIKGLKDRGANNDDVLLTDRFFLGQPQMRGFDFRGIGPRVVRRFYTAKDPDHPDVIPPLTGINSRATSNDALGGDGYYLGKIEVEIPLSSGARELGLRPSVFLDVGSVFGLKRPTLTDSPYPDGTPIPARDENGNPLYTQVNVATLVTPSGGGTPVCTPGTNPGDVTTVTNPVNPNPPACLMTADNAAINKTVLPPFVEQYYGNSAMPRLAIGFGVNWNSPFGPLRIDVAYPLLKRKGDDTKIVSFNVGTQF